MRCILSAARLVASRCSAVVSHSPTFLHAPRGESGVVAAATSHALRASSYSTSSPADLDILGQDAGLVRIDSCTSAGFVIGESLIPGALLAYRGLLTGWRVDSLESISEASLSIVDLLKPVPDLLVLGTGSQTLRLPPALARIARAKHLSVEVASTVNAVATFNILNQEGRKVVGAFLPLASPAPEVPTEAHPGPP